MAFIKCPKCGCDISDEAMSCALCGCLLSLADLQGDLDVESFPVLPDNLNISTPVVNWTGDVSVYVNYFSDTNYYNITSGDYEITIHKYGLCISRSHFPVLNIHKSQIVDIFEYDGVVAVTGNAMLRTFVGGALFGPVGAAIGNASARTEKEEVRNIICIKFWDVRTKNKVVLSFYCNADVTPFINRCNEHFANTEDVASLTEEEENEKMKKGCTTAVVVLIVLFVLFVLCGLWLEK